MNNQSQTLPSSFMSQIGKLSINFDTISWDNYGQTSKQLHLTWKQPDTSLSDALDSAYEVTQECIASLSNEGLTVRSFLCKTRYVFPNSYESFVTIQTRAS